MIGSVWNVTVGEPVLAREVSPSSSAYVVDVDFELVEADAADTTWEFRWELLGGGISLPFATRVEVSESLT